MQQLGLSFNNFLTDRRGYSAQLDKTLINILASAIINIKADPLYFWDARFQAIYNRGFDDIRGIATYYDLTRARSTAVFGSLRFLYRKLERPTLQWALSAGYKTFPDISTASDQWQLISNLFYRLGENFDLTVQLQHARFNGDLKNLFGSSETRLQFGLVYSIDQRWNKQFDDRNSLLNLEHGYIP